MPGERKIPATCSRLTLAPTATLKRIAGGKVQTACQRGAEHDLVRLGQKMNKIFLIQTRTREKMIVPQRSFGKGIDPQQQGRLGFWSLNVHHGFEHRSGKFYLGQSPHDRKQGLSQSGAGTLQPQFGLTRHSRHAGLKTFKGAAGGQRDAQVDRRAQGNAENTQEAAAGMLVQVPERKAQEPEVHGLSRPSCIGMMRSA